MLLNNLSIYQNILKNSKNDTVQREDKRYEVERLYSTSPIIFDYSETYLPDGAYMVEDASSSASKSKHDDHHACQNEEECTHNAKFTLTAFVFQPLPVEKINPEKPVVSALSRMIEESEVPDEESADQRENGGLALTIYLPDCNSLTVHVKESCNFRDVILRTLLTHEKQGIQPPLLYNDPGAYELRIHEGDGEPDRDFPALGNEKLLSDFNLDEYCICAVEGRRRASTNLDSGRAGPAAATGNSRGSMLGNTFGESISGNMSALQTSNSRGQGQYQFTPGNFGATIPHSNSAGQLSSAAMTFSALNYTSNRSRERDDTGYSSQSSGARQDRTRTYSKASYDSFQNSVSTVLVVFPDGTQVVVPFKEDTLLIQLLPKVHKLKRLRLYTNEYVFAVSAADQKHLKLMSPQLDMQQPVRTIGATTLEIQNKVYSDTSRADKNAAAAAAAKKKKAKYPKKSSNKSNFTEAMANAYQEWNVVKKNKFGRKQERVFGVDGKKIYNSKRGQLRGGNQTGVQRAERNISTIVKLDILPTDPKTFKITWMDDRDVYNIEYTCETTRECAEIVAKINYTREKFK